jgi:uncharacterized protein (DUF1919 family)
LNAHDVSEKNKRQGPCSTIWSIFWSVSHEHPENGRRWIYQGELRQPIFTWKSDYMTRLHEKSLKVLFRVRTRQRDFTIISNNCWGADLYPMLGLPYLTPFVGLFLRPDCYLRLLKDFRATIKLPLTFKNESHHPDVNELRSSENQYYPIGCIGDDIEIHFMHYTSREEAASKWLRRIQRITPDDSKLFVKFCDTNVPTHDQLRQFDAMPFIHKVCFTGQPQPDLESAVCIRGFEKTGHVENIQFFRHYGAYFDPADWLNGKTGKLSWWYRHLFS